MSKKDSKGTSTARRGLNILSKYIDPITADVRVHGPDLMISALLKLAAALSLATDTFGEDRFLETAEHEFKMISTLTGTGFMSSSVDQASATAAFERAYNAKTEGER